MTPPISVVIPVYQRDEELRRCLYALRAQSLPCTDYEIIIVDRGTDRSTQAIADRFEARRIQQPGRGLANARNLGLAAAQGEFIAFTDSDCIPSRHWLKFLSIALQQDRVWGVAGKTVGYESRSNAARFVDLTGGLDAEKYLAHPNYPWAPTINIMYRRDILQKAAGFDERYFNFEYCDLHQRLRNVDIGTFAYEPRAVIMHQHRSTWREYWHQQFFYGQGFGQFIWKYHTQFQWTRSRELRSWLHLGRIALHALPPGHDDNALIRHGTFIKELAQHLGFISTYYNRHERTRWQATDKNRI